MNEEEIEIKERAEIKNVYFRIRDGEKETAFVIPEDEYQKKYSDLEVIEEKPVLILKAK